MKQPHREAAHSFAGRRPRHIARLAALCVLALVLTAASTLGLAYLRLQGNIRQHDVETLLGTDRPTLPDDPNAGNALNILIIGSDVRTGDSDVDGAGAAGEIEGMRGDATMLLHISADRTRVEVVSIPRDMIVDIPECQVLDEDGNLIRTAPAQYDQRFNAAFATGGAWGNTGSAAACSMKTVEQMTGIRLDGFMVANFAAFKNIVDSIGGVPFYFEEDTYDSESGLNVTAGCRLLDGTQALALARARKSLGDGSDIGRIGRQQELVMTIVNEASSLNLFKDMGKLYKVLDTVTKNLETSSGLGDIPRLAGIVSSLRNMDFSTIKFITMPFEYSGPTVVPRAGTQAAVWDKLINDQPIEISVGNYGEIIEPQTAPDPAPAPEPGTADTTEPADTPTEAPQEPNTGETTDAPPVCTRGNATP